MGDGNFCEDDHLLEPGNDACGVMMGNNEVADNDQKKEKATLTNPSEFTYAVLAITKNKHGYNLKEGSLELTVKDDTHGYLRAVQILGFLKVPQSTRAIRSSISSAVFVLTPTRLIWTTRDFISIILKLGTLALDLRRPGCVKRCKNLDPLIR